MAQRNESESSSQKNLALPDPASTQLIEAAQPWIFRADYDTPSMELAMGEFWQTMLPDLPELIASRTKKPAPESLLPDFVYEVFGGKWKFYMPMLHDLVMRDLAKAAWPREPIFTTDFGVVEMSKGVSMSCLVYFVPKGSFESGVQQIVVKGIQPVDDAAVEAAVDRSLEAMRASKSMEREKVGVGATIEDGDMAWCTINARIDDKPWGAGSMQKSRVIVTKERLRPASLYEAILGKGVGNHRIEFRLSEEFGPLAWKVVQADLIVYAVLSYVLPDWTDELAQQLGKNSLEELRASQREAVRAAFVGEWEGRVADAALQALIGQVTFDPVPTEWVKMKAKDAFDRLLRQTRGDMQQVLASLGVPDEDTAMLRLYESARHEAWSIIALLSYGEHVGMERHSDETMGSLSAYLQRAVRHLIDHTVVVQDER